MSPLHTTTFGDIVQEVHDFNETDKVYAVADQIEYDYSKLVDANLYKLAPPHWLLNTFFEYRARRGPEMAWDMSNFEEQYLEYLQGDEERVKIARRVKAWAKNRDVYLVSYEGGTQYCYLSLLSDYIENQLKFAHEQSPKEV